MLLISSPRCSDSSIQVALLSHLSFIRNLRLSINQQMGERKHMKSHYCLTTLDLITSVHISLAGTSYIVNLNRGKLRIAKKSTEGSRQTKSVPPTENIRFTLETKGFLILILVLKCTFFSHHSSPCCDLMKKRNYTIRGSIALRFRAQTRVSKSEFKSRSHDLLAKWLGVGHLYSLIGCIRIMRTVAKIQWVDVSNWT